MERLPTLPQSTLTRLPRSYDSSFEFPTSPQSTLGEEKLHFSHPQHPLARANFPELFTCDGCKEFGAGKRFTCHQCDFQLHEFCALPPSATLKNHPLHGQHQLILHPKSKPVKGGMFSPRCDICAKPTMGFTFRCGACSFQMHPCCAKLSNEMNFSFHLQGVHPHSLKLLPATTTLPNGDPGFACGECKRKRSGRVYRCTVCDYHLHAVCAKDMINGLKENGIKPPQNPSMMGTVFNFASLVVLEFVGGLIEGIGQGFGDAFIQNIARGSRNSRRIE